MLEGERIPVQKKKGSMDTLDLLALWKVLSFIAIDVIKLKEL